MSELYSLVNVYLPDGTWAGQFTDEATARSWLKSKGYKLDEVEISRRRVDRKTRKAQEETPSEMAASS